MKLLALGVDHRTAPAAVREALAFDGPRRDEGLDALAAAFPGGEFVVLSTCNRVEVYAAGDGRGVPDDRRPDRLPRPTSTRRPADGFARAPGRPPRRAGGRRTCSGSPPAWRAWSWARGRSSARSATPTRRPSPARPSGRSSTRSSRHALRVGKLVRERDRAWTRGKLSVASVAVDVARDVFDTFADKTVLVIGAGKMGDLTLQHLAALRPGSILVTNRNPERAEAAAARWGGRAVPFDRLEPGPDRGRRRRQHHRRRPSRSSTSTTTRGSRRPAGTAWP